MTGTKDARARLLDATHQLLREGGAVAATPAAVAERAGAGKMSLYRHFEGKDELLAACLREREPEHRAWLLRDGVLAMFDRAAERAERPGFAACPWAVTRLEVHDPAHPVAAAAREHKQAMARDIAALVGDDELARVLLMLLDGALVHAIIAGDGTPLREARTAAAALLRRRRR